MATGKVKTLYSDKEKTEALFPRTKTSAVSDEQGVGLDAYLDDMIFTGEVPEDTAVAPVNADTLGGRPASDFATETFVANKIAEAQMEGGGNSNVDFSGFATKDDVQNLAYISEVNQESATVPLNADTLDGKAQSAFMQYAAMPDYIVEQGTSGIWTYRKWNSGIAECWGVETGISLNIGTAYGNVYHGDRRLSSPVLPFAISNPILSVNVVGGGGTDFVGNVAYGDNKIAYYWLNPTTYAFSNGQAQYYVIGKWK